MSQRMLARRALLLARGSNAGAAPAASQPTLNSTSSLLQVSSSSGSGDATIVPWAPPSAHPVRQLWSSPASHMSAGLRATLQEELNYEVENKSTPEVVAQGPPAPFQLTEAPGDTLLTLSRMYGQNEQVSIILHVNNQPSADFGDEDAEAAEEALSTVTFNTQISKQGEEKALVFECETDGTFVAINHISYEPVGGHESPSKYTGPVFDELDEVLQREFQIFLEERGITPALGEYLRHLVHDKEEREYMAWLDNIRKFIEK